MMAWLCAIVVVAIAGSLVQDLLLPRFLRQPDETPMEMTEASILAMVLDDMESFGLIKLTPHADRKPLIEGKPPTEDQHTSEKAAA
jgi:hypothetical protein